MAWTKLGVSVGISDIWGQISLGWGAVLCIVASSAASLVYTY